MSDDILDIFETQSDALAEFQKAEGKVSEMVYAVFDTEQGKKLLEYWVDNHVLTPSINPQSTQFEAGLIEGEKNFVRRIILSMHKAEQIEDKPSIFHLIKTKLLEVTK